MWELCHCVFLRLEATRADIDVVRRGAMPGVCCLELQSQFSMTMTGWTPAHSMHALVEATIRQLGGANKRPLDPPTSHRFRTNAIHYSHCLSPRTSSRATIYVSSSVERPSQNVCVDPLSSPSVRLRAIFGPWAKAPEWLHPTYNDNDNIDNTNNNNDNDDNIS